VAPSGIHVIDAKRHKGAKVRLRKRGLPFNRRIDLYVGGRKRTNLVEAMTKQVLAVDRAAGELVRNPPTPITAVLCFVDADFGLLPSPQSLNGVHVTWRRGLRKLLRRPGPLNAEQIAEIASRVAQILPPK
jgi:hypothetical protein